MVEPPDEAGQGARLGDPGFGAQVAGRLAGGGGAEHLVAGALEGLRHGPEHRGLACTGHAHDQLRPPARCADAGHGGALLVRQPGTDGLLGAGVAASIASGGDGPVGAAQLAGQALGDGALPGQYRSQRMGRSRAPATLTSGTTSGSAKARSTNRSSTSGRWPKTCGARATTRWRREKTLRRARSPSGPSTSETSARTPLALSGWTASRS